MVSLGLSGLGIEEAPNSARPHYYMSAAGTATLSRTGGHANVDAIERDAAPPHTLHVEGDVTCGTPIRS